jgi:hypothetical protein
MTRLPKKRGITQAEADKSLILRSLHSLINGSEILRSFVMAQKIYCV